MKTNMLRWLLASLSGVALVALAGACSLLAGKPQAVAQPDDMEVRARVETALAQDPAFKTDAITVQSCYGIVELTGAVACIADKERAGLIAASVPDVVQVKNDVSVRVTTGK